MGLFSKKTTQSGNPVLVYPGNNGPDPGVDAADYLADLALSKTADSPIPSADVMSYGEATYAHILGIPDRELIIAWGPSLIETPRDKKPTVGTAVLTRNTFLAYWQPGRAKLIHTFQGDLSAVSRVQTLGPYSMTVLWDVAQYADDQGKSLVSNAPMTLAPHFTKDGHANRRALTWFAALNRLVSH